MEFGVCCLVSSPGRLPVTYQIEHRLTNTEMFSLGALERWNKKIDSNSQVWSHVYQNQILKFVLNIEVFFYNL